MIIPFDQVKDYDSIRFRVIVFEVHGETLYCLVEEKIKGSYVIADKRRHLDEKTFFGLREEVINAKLPQSEDPE